mgnify:CR=1 FL=1
MFIGNVSNHIEGISMIVTFIDEPNLGIFTSDKSPTYNFIQNLFLIDSQKSYHGRSFYKTTLSRYSYQYFNMKDNILLFKLFSQNFILLLVYFNLHINKTNEDILMIFFDVFLPELGIEQVYFLQV